MHERLKALRDPWPSRIRRRLVTLPVLVLAWAIATALFPLFLVVGAAADVARRGPAVLARSVVFFTFFLWCEVLGVVAAFFLWVLWGWQERAFLDGNHRLQRMWNRALLFGGGRVFGMSVDVEGTEALRAPGPLIVLVRHVSTVDAVIPVSLLEGFRFRFVLKRELLSDPCLDVVGNRLPNFFAARGSGHTDGEIARMLALLADLTGRDAIVVYPEGTRFTARRREKLVERTPLARELHHTLPPLTTGTVALLKENARADVLFIAHTGLEGAGGFPAFIRGGLVGARVKVKMWRVPCAKIPREHVEEFLADNWRIVDAFVRSQSGGAR